MADETSADIVAGLTRATQDWLGGGPDQSQAPAPGAITATLVTNITPPIDLSGTGGGGFSGKLLGWIQPSIVGTLPIIGSVNVAPYGVANAALGTVVFYTIFGLAAYGAYKLLMRR